MFACGEPAAASLEMKPMDFDRIRRITHARMISRCRVINETLDGRSLPHHAVVDMDFLIREIKAHIGAIVAAGTDHESESAGTRQNLVKDLTIAADHLASARAAIESCGNENNTAKVHVSRAFKAIMDHAIASERRFTDRLAGDRRKRQARFGHRPDE